LTHLPVAIVPRRRQRGVDVRSLERRQREHGPASHGRLVAGGGELSIRLGARTVEFKGKAGTAVVYPSNTLHEVKPVTRGERLVGLTFIESMVPDAVHRDLLYELNEVAALEGFNISQENRTRLEYVRNYLRRMWGEAG
jgi:PKHD-type hydroxylase